MNKHRSILVVVATLVFLAVALKFAARPSGASGLRVAVASNFADTIRGIAERFEAKTGHEVTLIFGSTGKHYAQITNGAPFEVFFAADTHRPQLLEEEGLALPGSRFTYAVGKVVLWSPEAGYVDAEAKVLERADFRHLAIANPKLAPYGRAAQEVLQQLGVWDGLAERLVRGQNVIQTLQFIKSDNAELGFVAYSQVVRPGRPVEGSWWLVPQTLYSPIKQQAVLLKQSEVGADFLAFARSAEALEIIRAHGYDTP
ncbi:MAG: molybdate ABC transporter substrate-binding protein [Planctomycetota bacterium]|jgi:molybdate transport system substrate-binding protein